MGKKKTAKEGLTVVNGGNVKQAMEQIGGVIDAMDEPTAEGAPENYACAEGSLAVDEPVANAGQEVPAEAPVTEAAVDMRTKYAVMIGVDAQNHVFLVDMQTAANTQAPMPNAVLMEIIQNMVAKDKADEMFKHMQDSIRLIIRDELMRTMARGVQVNG